MTEKEAIKIIKAARQEMHMLYEALETAIDALEQVDSYEEKPECPDCGLHAEWVIYCPRCGKYFWKAPKEEQYWSRPDE